MLLLYLVYSTWLSKGAWLHHIELFQVTIKNVLLYIVLSVFGVVIMDLVVLHVRVIIWSSHTCTCYVTSKTDKEESVFGYMQALGFSVVQHKKCLWCLFTKDVWLHHV
jgi:hypothetical protein